MPKTQKSNPLEKIVAMIEEDFPTFKVKEITGYSFQGDDLTGVLVDEGNRAYSFFVDASDPHPMLKRL